VATLSVYVCAHHMPWYTQHGIHSVYTDPHVSMWWLLGY